MTNVIKNENKILKNPKNYAAIYARTSSKIENNSIDAQIIKAKNLINNKNLLLYAAYVDTVSGYSISPSDRDGFGKLLEDAKAGCFKTLVAYKHDRIARNLNDWVNLKNQFRKLKIKIIFSDDTEYSSDDSVQGEFLENLIVMVGELEPNSIKERTSAGKLQRRQEGVYSSGKHIPFGYLREASNIKNPSKGKSHYTIDPLKAIFIQHLFCEAKEVFGKKTIKVENIRRNLESRITKLLKVPSLKVLSEVLVTYANDIKSRLVNSHEKEVFLNEISRLLYTHLNESKLEIIRAELVIIKDHLNDTSNINSILKNSTYGGYMLLKLNEEDNELGVIIEDKIPRLKEAAFIRLTNVAPIIDKKTFAKVYSYMLMPSILKEKEPNYLFKGNLKCGGKCKVLLHLSNGLLQCNCKSYGKDSVIEAILDIIIDDAFGKSDTGFNSFCNAIAVKVIVLRVDLQKLRNKKLSELKDYLSSKNQSYVKTIQHIDDEINTLLDKIATYADELSYINKLQQVIKCYNSVPKTKELDSNISIVKASIITHIISNQNIFNSVFNKLIKEIKVSTIEKKDALKCRFTINYEFNYVTPSTIPTRIY